MKPEEVKLGYLVISAPVPNTYLGGVMVTDGHGLPLEFRYTEPIQPTKIQQILYGQVLGSYIKRDVILDALLGSLESKPAHLLVQDESLMKVNLKGSLSGQTNGQMVVRLSETQTPKLGDVGTLQPLSETEVLLQASAETNPLRLQFNAGTPLEGVGTPLSYLMEAAQTMDLAEPMKRIERALETICQEAGIKETGKDVGAKIP